MGASSQNFEQQAETAGKPSPNPHGNSLNTPKPAEGYGLYDRKTGALLKYGETTLGKNRYSRAKLGRLNADMKMLTEPMEKWAAKAWQTMSIREYEQIHSSLPPLNKSYQ
jgi:hypothetical protein